jgi:hypothetical protein
MRSSFKTRRASQKCKTSANYMAAVPGIKSFFAFSEKWLSARVGDATGSQRVNGVKAATDSPQRKRRRKNVTAEKRRRHNLRRFSNQNLK